ncbi:hypothetical protein HZ326_0126 [Fusarium oxysporum f. sp. albedinis]|nr:hypothetical protein HZ326_0126 [Fusarium oxysporum f. sp. albedinis]
MAIIRLLDYKSVLAWNMLLLCPLLKFDLKLPERRLITTMAQPHEINASGSSEIVVVICSSTSTISNQALIILTFHIPPFADSAFRPLTTSLI